MTTLRVLVRPMRRGVQLRFVEYDAARGTSVGVGRLHLGVRTWARLRTLLRFGAAASGLHVQIEEPAP